MTKSKKVDHSEKNPSEVSWARLAAFIDGEGCIFINKNASRFTGTVRTNLEVKIANCSPLLMTWLQSEFGGSISLWGRATRGGGKWTQGYYWGATGEQVTWVLTGCLPYFVIKRDQAEIGLAHQALRSKKSGYGSRLAPEVVTQRLELRDKLSLIKGQATRRKDLIPATETERKVG